MAREKTKSELEWLREEVKTLKAENRHLKRSLSRKEKREFLFDSLEEKQKEIADAKQAKSKNVGEERCPSCGGLGVLLEVTRLFICDECGKRCRLK